MVVKEWDALALAVKLKEASQKRVNGLTEFLEMTEKILMLKTDTNSNVAKVKVDATVQLPIFS